MAQTSVRDRHGARRGLLSYLLPSASGAMPVGDPFQPGTLFQPHHLFECVKILGRVVRGWICKSGLEFEFVDCSLSSYRVCCEETQIPVVSTWYHLTLQKLRGGAEWNVSETTEHCLRSPSGRQKQTLTRVIDPKECQCPFLGT